MRMEISTSNGQILKDLFEKHIEQGEPLNPESMLKLVNVRDFIEYRNRGPLTKTQAILMDCHLDLICDGAMRIDPVTISTIQQGDLTIAENNARLAKHRQKLYDKFKIHVKNFGRHTFPLDTIVETLYTIKFLRTFLVLGTGEVSQGKIPQLAN